MMPGRTNPSRYVIFSPFLDLVSESRTSVNMPFSTRKHVATSPRPTGVGLRVDMRDGEVLDAQYKVDRFESRLSASMKLTTSVMKVVLRTASTVRPLEDEAIVVRGFRVGLTKVDVDNVRRVTEVSEPILSR
jgi:hypothetical protein